MSSLTSKPVKGANMAPRKKSGESQQPVPPNPPTNEMVASSVQKQPLGKLVTPQVNVVKDTEARKAMFLQSQAALELTELEAIMASIKYSQSVYTEGLNALSSYRKTVASLLEIKRRESAAARKASVQRTSKPSVVVTAENVLPDESK